MTWEPSIRLRKVKDRVKNRTLLTAEVLVKEFPDSLKKAFLENTSCLYRLDLLD